MAGRLVISLCDIVTTSHFELAGMNKKQQATLSAVFEKPTRADIRWSRVESPIKALGGEISERALSRVALELNGVIAVFHRPHPGPEAQKGAVEAVRQLLRNAGVEP